MNSALMEFRSSRTRIYRRGFSCFSDRQKQYAYARKIEQENGRGSEEQELG